MSKKAARRPSPAKGWRVLIGSGVNLDLLGQREPAVYGHETLADMEILLQQTALELGAGGPQLALHFLQTNDEGEYLQALGQGWDGAVLNPGAWTHTSLALADRLAGLKLPFVEVHLSRIAAREPIRQQSFIAALALGSVAGFGIHSYRLGLLGLVEQLAKRPVR